LLQRQGLQVVCLPAMVILPPLDTAPAVTLAGKPERIDATVFVSRYALDGALRLLPPAALARLRSLPAFAPGTATARGLREQGFAQVVHPRASSGSEALLALPQLQARQVAGRRIVIFRGNRGREHLHLHLQRRGAVTEYVQTYRRIPAPLPSGELRRLCRRAPPAVIVVTSCEGLHNLYHHFTPELRGYLLRARLVAPGRRIGSEAQSLGWKPAAMVSCEAGDEGLLAGVRCCLEAIPAASA